jgi:xylulose-5-phosphate/fructose-6-phosphate phosphoketolase
MDAILSKKGIVARINLPPDANCLLSVADHCFASHGYVNAIIIDKQPQLQWLDMNAAREHCTQGASVWAWASNDAGAEPDVVLACAGDIPTLETVAAASWLRRNAPGLRVRVVNVVDLMALFNPSEHPHGMAQAKFVELFHDTADVIFAFHGYRGAAAIRRTGVPSSGRIPRKMDISPSWRSFSNELGGKSIMSVTLV